MIHLTFTDEEGYSEEVDIDVACNGVPEEEIARFINETYEVENLSKTVNKILYGMVYCQRKVVCMFGRGEDKYPVTVTVEGN